MGMLDNLGFGFTEKMGGTYTPKNGKLPGGKFYFDFEVDSDDVTQAAKQIDAQAVGTVFMEGVAENVPAEGTLHLSPLWERKIRYTFSFAGKDGRRYKFDGWKTINWLRVLSSWTTLPGRIFDEKTGEVVAEALTHFDMKGEFLKLLSSFRTQPKR